MINIDWFRCTVCHRGNHTSIAYALLDIRRLHRSKFDDFGDCWGSYMIITTKHTLELLRRSRNRSRMKRHRYRSRSKKVAQMAFMMLLANISVAEQAQQINVSATIPPRPCEYPKRCDPVERHVTTSVTVKDSVIYYVGSPPSVTLNNNLMLIIF